ncbi:MAG: hypothetical protein CMH46_08765 [Muricauda sp.]|nr:hypothetical protein [Allomuricauda sp.]
MHHDTYLSLSILWGSFFRIYQGMRQGSPFQVPIFSLQFLHVGVEGYWSAIDGTGGLGLN